MPKSNTYGNRDLFCNQVIKKCVLVPAGKPCYACVREQPFPIIRQEDLIMGLDRLYAWANGGAVSSACGAGDKPSACGGADKPSACGGTDKPSACGAGDK